MCLITLEHFPENKEEEKNLNFAEFSEGDIVSEKVGEATDMFSEPAYLETHNPLVSTALLL